MMKITFMGAGSTVFAKNVLGDCMCTEALRDSEIALYDIDETRLKESKIILSAINKNINNSRAKINCYLGTKNRKDALRNANFVVNAIQVGGYDPCTITDFEIPKKYGLKQTIGDTLGIGGIMRGLRTIPVMADFARDMEEVCPNTLFLNYTNPMSILTGYMQRFTNIKTIGLCHSVQVCSENLLKALNMENKLDGRKELIAGINHMAWLLEIYDRDGNDLYPEIKNRAQQKNASEKHDDMVRYEYIKHLGYYCTESSEHNSEYNPFFIKSKYPELIEKFNIPLDEYPRRCVDQIERWAKEKENILQNGEVSHTRSKEYASYIMESIVTNTPYKIGGNVLNTGLIDNIPKEACVEVPCLVDAMGIHPIHVGTLPTQLAAMNMSNINVQLLTIEAAVTKDKQKIYQATMMDPHTSSELSIDDIIKMCDELITAHGDFMKDYK
ncbi:MULTISPECIES: alpha-glucosidase/alpha-galactosidase [Clostridium]|uniref:alpha-glucosidase/alpha-galactosidase n=1 Tax=Clostridium TaxID=1485 RepID=UPI0006E71B87|nr:MULTISPECIES: alpha-glucosidase/alpha-galactosidase [Clostridium]KQB77193.1 alpha-galactosidase [Clostridium butyricum]MDB2136901.1 alpha-glucosidase/alpha-galactosidase [Clostridium butyricum]MDI9210232.1 alpha-glucosidase/alpha-galactosidase [Clostridium butyricum]MDU1116977.1 alpha-glucosidase/alpha-galactosidase [Clostridium sp.]MDU1338860.1 alpha-glucosidase/alpha-galactosidase [Clostridium butyricum]